MLVFSKFEDGVPIRVFHGAKKGLEVGVLEEYLAVCLFHAARIITACKTLPVYVDLALPGKRPYDGLTSGTEKLVFLARVLLRQGFTCHC